MSGNRPGSRGGNMIGNRQGGITRPEYFLGQEQLIPKQCCHHGPGHFLGGSVLPPGTASRLATGMAGNRPGSRGGTVGGGVGKDEMNP